LRFLFFGSICVNKYKALFGITVKELDINQVPLEEDWMGSNVEDEEESSNGDPPRKKLRLTKEQSRLLEESFRQNHTLNPVTLKLSLSLIKYVIYIIKRWYYA